MATEAGAAMQVDGQAEEVASFSKAVDVIIPPPNIKEIVDRTGDFVKKVGTQFEAEIIQRNAGSRKFDFLQPSNPYHAYYRQRVKYGADAPTTGAHTDAAEPDTEADAADAAKAKAEEEAKAKAAAAAARKPKTLLERMRAYEHSVKELGAEASEAMMTDDKDDAPAPVVEKYTIKHPDFQAVDIDIIKLTALFVATNGRTFLSGLTTREARNPQFDFLKPTHPLFSFFQKLTDAYAQVKQPAKETLEGLTSDVREPRRVMQRGLALAQWRAKQTEKERRREEDDEEERVAMQLIDWHQFVVVETITFDPRDEHLLPEPKSTIDDINLFLEAQAKQQQMASEDTQGGGGDDMDMDMDDDMDDDMDEDEDDSAQAAAAAAAAEPELRVLTEAQLKKRRANDRSTQYQKCPVCGEEILLSELQEHIRIELLDPQWKVKKKLLEERQKETSLAQATTIGANLKRLAKNRADVFADDKELFKPEAPQPEYNWRDDGSAAKDAAAAKARAAAAKAAADRAFKAQQQQQQAQREAAARNVRAPVAPPRPPAAAPPRAAMPMPAAFSRPAPPPGGPVPPPRMPPMPQGGFRGAHPPPAGAAPPAAKRARVGAPPVAAPPAQPPAPKKPAKAKLLPEAEWVKTHAGPYAIKVIVPEDESRGWGFKGQTEEVSLAAMKTIKDLKAELATRLNGMPAGKMKINVQGGSFLNKDKFTLAHYNLKSGITLLLGVRERGGRKR